MFKHPWVRLGVVVGLCLGGLETSWAAPTSDDFTTSTNRLSSDWKLLSQWQSDNLTESLAFHAASGVAFPADVIKLGGFELGFAGVVSSSKLDNGALLGLPTQVVRTQDLDRLNRLPIPAAVGHVKIGLPGGWDVGGKAGGFSETLKKGDSRSKVKNTVWGIEIRKALIADGLTRPFGLALSATLDGAQGSLELTDTYNKTSPNVTMSGRQFDITPNTKTVDKADWNVKSLGGRLILSKKLPILHPYIGAAVNRNFGTVRSGITTTGDVTLKDLSDGQTATQSVGTLSGSASAEAGTTQLRLLAGTEISLLALRLGLYGEYTARHFAGTLGLRFQFR
ncbi:MAG: hypothetical protein HYZ73_05975 [Elusimicrobia bacterium]|nr:hypothetical protein [Elusimicrobiota bacterium]